MSKYIVSDYSLLCSEKSLFRLITVDSFELSSDSFFSCIAVQISSRESFLQMINVSPETKTYEFDNDDEALLWFKLNY